MGNIVNLDSFVILIDIEGEIRIIKFDIKLPILFEVSQGLFLFARGFINFVIDNAHKLATICGLLLCEWL